MARANKLAFVALLAIASLMVNFQPSTSQTTQQLIEKICRSMENYGFCRRTFDENLKSPNADIVALTQITIERATDNATQTHDFIRQLLEKEQDPNLKNALGECENAYRVIMESFDNAAVSFFQKDYDSVQEDEQVTPRLEQSCEASIHASPKSPDILDVRNTQMRILIAMAVTTVLELLGIHA